MSLQSINVSRELVLDGVEVSLGEVDKVSSVLLSLGSKIRNSLNDRAEYLCNIPEAYPA